MNRTVQDLVRCADCKRTVPRLEASEQVTHEGRKVRCFPCGDKAFIRALRFHHIDTPNDHPHGRAIDRTVLGEVGNLNGGER